MQTLIGRIHDSPLRVVIVMTGGGSGAIAELLSVPGASRTVLEARVPYGRRALIDFLGTEPEQFCSAETARSMAVVAYLRAGGLQEGNEPVAGVAGTASLVTDRPKRGAHRCHIAVHDARSTTTYSLVLEAESRDRLEEEQVVARLILLALVRACGLGEEVPLPLMGGERVQTRRTVAPEPVRKLFAHEVQRVSARRDGRFQPDGPVPPAVLPGAFHPLHDGHRELVRVAGEILGTDVAYEMSLFNVDKPPLDYTDLEDRLAQFAGQADVVLTCAPTFVEKARVLPGCTFVVGFDTAERIVAPHYYGSDEAMTRALDEMRRLGCRFLVAGRVKAGRFCTLADVPVPPGYEDLFHSIPESQFRSDLSSTILRAQRHQEDD